MITAAGVRVAWTGLPFDVRSRVEDVLGSQVVHAVTQPGGFSPGSADRVTLADGRRAFVKAVSSAVNPDTPQLHRTEAAIARRLPSGTPAPALLGSVDTGDWVALCFADIAGRHPRTPWVDSEVVAALQALDVVARLTFDATDWPNPPISEAVLEDFAGWERIAADPPLALPIVAAQHLNQLRDLASDGVAVGAGTALCHLDIRADNLLVDEHRRLWIVDWPWAAAGAPWIDSLMLLVNVSLYGDRSVERFLPLSATLTAAPADHIDMFLAGLAAFYVDAGRKPDPPGLPTVRLFQRQQGDAVLAWLARRLGW